CRGVAVYGPLERRELRTNPGDVERSGFVLKDGHIDYVAPASRRLSRRHLAAVLRCHAIANSPPARNQPTCRKRSRPRRDRLRAAPARETCQFQNTRLKTCPRPAPAGRSATAARGGRSLVLFRSASRRGRPAY